MKAALQLAVAAAVAAMGGTACAAVAAAQPAQGGACRAESGSQAPVVVELYTSEGCSSCPPADRWLSTLAGRDDVVALGFHVHYWDHLGWPDRFASAENTARQTERNRELGSRSVYTPQVIADGRDWRQWPALPVRPARLAPGAAPAPRLSLAREGQTVEARVEPVAGPAGRYGGYWAVVEDRHASQVRAGENSGATLRHDHVVRQVRVLPEWAADAGQRSRLEVGRGVPEHPRRVVFVITDAQTRRPVQALALAC